MTVTSPSPGQTARRSSVFRPGLGRRARRVLAVTAVLVLGAPVAAVASVAPADAGAVQSTTPAPTPTPTPDVPLGETVFTLSPVANGTVRPGEELAVSVTLQNGTLATTAPAAVTLFLGSEPLEDREELTAWLAGENEGVALAPVGSTTLEPVLPQSQQVNGIVVAPGDPALAGRTPGVYPLSATYESPNGPVVSTSAMIVPREGAPAVGVGVVVPITAGATADGLLTALELTALTSPSGSLTNQLDAVEGTEAIIAVDPAIPAAIRVLGTSAPVSATAWLARLESLSNSRFALQFGDADLAPQLQAGLARPLRPISLQAYMDPADFVAPHRPLARSHRDPEP